MFGGMGRLGSSESDSGGAGEGVVGGGGCARCSRRADGAEILLLSVAATALGAGAGVASESAFGGSGAGVSSMVECFPVVHGGIERNSSNVRTRGLQHFQPGGTVRSCSLLRVGEMKGHPDTFLAFMEDGRARMIDAVFL